MTAVWDTNGLLRLVASFLASDCRGEIRLMCLLRLTERNDRQYRWRLLFEWMNFQELDCRRRNNVYAARRRAFTRLWMREYRCNAPFYFYQLGTGRVSRVHHHPQRVEQPEEEE